MITKICSNRNASKVTKEKELYVYEISHDIPFDIGRVITEDILKCTKRLWNTAIGFPSLITELCMLRNVPIVGNEEKTPHPYPISIKCIKIRPRKSVRGEASKSMQGYDYGWDEFDEEGEGDEEEDAATIEDEEEPNEILPLGHQGKLILERVGNMFCNALKSGGPYTNHKLAEMPMDIVYIDTHTV